MFVYPIWWGTIPALLKGFIERTFLPGFAVNFHEHSIWWDKLLTGKSARLIVTLNTPSWYYRWVLGQPGHKTMKKTILEFSGVKPVRITEIGPVKGSTEEQRKGWMGRIKELGKIWTDSGGSYRSFVFFSPHRSQRSCVTSFPDLTSNFRSVTTFHL